MEGQAGYIDALRKPGRRIYLRMEGGGRAWDPQDPYIWAQMCAGAANRFRPDCLIPWNESNLEWTSLFRNADDEEGWWALKGFAQTFLPEYRRLSSIPIAWPAMSPGHREDDFQQFGLIVKDISSHFDETHLHCYWTTEAGSSTSQWWGRRWQRLMALYGKRKYFVSEFNRVFNRNDVSDVDRLCGEILEWSKALPCDAAWFIEDSGDPSFAPYTIHNIPQIAEAFRLANRQESPVSASIHINPIGTVSSKLTVSGTSVPPGAVTMLVHFPLRGDNKTAYTTDLMRFVQTAADGSFSVDFDIPAVFDEGPIDASVQVNSYAFEGGGFAGTIENQTFRIDQGAPAPPPPPAIPGLDPRIDLMWRYAGDVVNRGIDIQNAIRAMKGELPDPK